MPAKRKLPPGVYPSGRTHYQYRIQPPNDHATGERVTQIVRGGFETADAAVVARAEHRQRLGLDDTPATSQTVAQYIETYAKSHARNVSISLASNTLKL